MAYVRDEYLGVRLRFVVRRPPVDAVITAAVAREEVG